MIINNFGGVLFVLQFQCDAIKACNYSGAKSEIRVNVLTHPAENIPKKIIY